MKLPQIFKQPKIKTMGMIIIVIIIGLIILRPLKTLWLKNKELTQEIIKKKEEYDKGKNLASMQKNLNSEIKQLETKLSDIQMTFRLDIEEILLSLNRFAEELKISLKNVDPQEKVRIEAPERKDIYVELLPIIIKVKCDYRQLRGFLNKIESSIWVETVDIQNDSRDIWNHDIQLQLKAPLLAK